MPGQRDTLVSKMVAEGTSDDDIRATLKAFDAQQAPAAAAPPLSRAGYYQGVVEAAPQVARAAVDALPAIGGMIGGLVGKVPGARMVTAGIGGAAGEGYRQLLTHAGELPGAMADVARNAVRQPAATLRGFGEGAAEGVKDAAIQGGIQAAAQGGGELLSAGASTAAPWLMNRALNLTDKLSREFPNLSKTMIEHSLTVTNGGLSKARTMLNAAKTEANAALAQADAAGARVPITAATDGLSKTLTKVLDSEDIEGGLRALASVEAKMLKGRGADLTNVAADALKKTLQTESKALYTAQKMGAGRPNVGVRAQAIADMAQSLNAGIADITEKAGAMGYKLANADAAEMIGAVRGITKGIRPGANLYQAMVRPGVGAVMGGVVGAESGGTKGAVPGALIGGALTSPAGMSRLAVTLAKPSVKAMLVQSPRLAALLAQLMTQEQEPQ
jgi:hypothetical protein